MKWIRASLLAVAGCTVPGLLTGAATVLFFPVPRDVHAYIGRFAVASMTSWWIWAAMTPLVRAAMRRVPLERPWAKPLAAHGLFALAAAVVFACWYAGVLWLSRPPTLPASSYGAEFRRFVMGCVTGGLVAYASIVAVTTAIDERRARRTRELETARLAADLAQAQLRALQAQLQPHFLFNTLHGIAMLTDTDPAAAERMAVTLAELLRATLRLHDVPEIALDAELALLRTYLEIEAARFGDRLTVTFAVPDALLGLPVPSFILQPVVENAVRHGVAPRLEGGRVWVRASRDAGALLLTVEDDGAGFRDDPPAATGVGLRAMRDRLALRYGAAASLRCEPRSDGAQSARGARVTIRIPLDETTA